MATTGEEVRHVPIERPLSRLALLCFVLAVISLAAAILSGISHRYGWWSLGTSFTVLRWSVYAALATFALGTAAVLRVRPGSPRIEFWLVFTAIVIGIGFSSYLLNWRSTARSVPPIHDISTDLGNPPIFVDVLPLRDRAPERGADLAAQQKEGYPDLGPLELDVGTKEAFDRVVEAATALDWDIVASAPGEGRLEATDTTFWYGFKDDIVVRVSPSGSGARIDVRSVSREGRSDIGTNARRIRRFLERIGR